MKFLEISWNIDGDSTALCYHWRWLTKVWGSNQIRYLSSPHPKYWVLWFLYCFQRLCYHSASVVRRQRWNGMELSGLDTNSEACGLIGRHPLNLTLSLVLHGCRKQVRWLFYPALSAFKPLTTSTHGPHERGYTRATMYDFKFFNNFVLSAYSWLELAFLQLELLVIAGHHTAVNSNLEIVQITRQVGKVWLPVTRYHSLSPRVLFRHF